MEGEKPGFGFRPNDEELVGYYLRHKLQGNDSLVDGVIREFKICSLDPWNLRFKSKIKSRDLVWYFLSRRENNGSRQKRRTPSGFWKLTGESVDVKDRWGHLSGFPGKTIGHKRVLVFGRGTSTSSKSDWVMHEFHYTLLPEDKRTYVICRLEYKGDDIDIVSANPTDPIPTLANSASSVVDQSFQGTSGYYNTLSEYGSAAYQGHQFNGNYDMQQSLQGYSEYFNPTLEYGLDNQSHWFSNLQQQPQVPYSAPYQDNSDMLKQVVEEYLPYLLDERTDMREDSSHYRPKNSVTGILPDYSTDDDDTDSTITWSSTESVGSQDVPYHTPKDDTSSLSPVEPLHNHEAQEQPKQLESQLQGKAKVVYKQKSKCDLKMAEDSIKKAPSTTAVKQSWIVLEEMSQRNSRWVHLNNMLIGLLLFISIIGWIILVG